MKRFPILVFFAAAPVAAWAQPAGSASVLLKADRVLDVKTGTYQRARGVLIEGERIAAAGDFGQLKKAASPQAQIIDLGGLVLLPGLVDAHAHLLDEMPTINPGSAIILAVTQMSPSKRALLGARMAREDLEGGFTTVRNVGHSGIDGDVALRDGVNEGWLPGPRILASGRKITPIGGQAVQLQPAVTDEVLLQEFLPISGAEDARRAVKENLYRGADWIKAVVNAGQRSLTLEELRAIVEEAHRNKMRVAVHASTADAIQTAVDAGVDSIEHADGATPQQLEAMHDKGIFLVATDVMNNGRFLDLLEMTYKLSPATRQQILQHDRHWSLYIFAGVCRAAFRPQRGFGPAQAVSLRCLRNSGQARRCFVGRASGLRVGFRADSLRSTRRDSVPVAGTSCAVPAWSTWTSASSANSRSASASRWSFGPRPSISPTRRTSPIREQCERLEFHAGPERRAGSAPGPLRTPPGLVAPQRPCADWERCWRR